MNENITPDAQPKSSRRILPHVARVLMGLAFFIFGLNGLHKFIPQPTTAMPEGVVAFSSALKNTGYMMQLIAGTQFVVGILLLLNRFVPLALVLIAPVLVNIIAFHVFLQPAGIGPGAFLTLLEIYLAWEYRNVYRPILGAKATPGA